MRVLRVLLLAVLAARPAAAWCDSLGWRGDGSGRYPDAAPPLEWSTDRNVVWCATVGDGRSSPVVVGDRVFVTAEPDLLVCLDKATGKVLWRRTNGLSDLPIDQQPAQERPSPTECGYATPTPCSDGKCLYALFGTGIVACHGLDGDRRWITFIDAEQREPHGRAGSPVLAGGRLIVLVNCLIGLDPATGRIAWRCDEVEPSFATPLRTRIGGVEVVVAPQGEVVRAADGKILARGAGKAYCASAIANDGVLHVADATAKAVKLPDEAAEGGRVQELWTRELKGMAYASPVFHDGLIHGISKDGEYWVVDARSGQVLLERRLLTDSEVSASVTLAGQHLFIHSDAGTTCILEPGPEGKIVGINNLAGGISGTPAFDGSRMFLRSGNKLYCLGQ